LDCWQFACAGIFFGFVKMRLLLERERPMERPIEVAGSTGRNGKHEVLIPLWNQERPGPLLDLAAAITANDAKTIINVLNMVFTPPMVPLEITPDEIIIPTLTNAKDLFEATYKLVEKGISVGTQYRPDRTKDTGTITYIESNPNVALILTSWTGS
jgi:hypothetical protein